MRVHHGVRIRVVDRLVEDGAETRHRDQVDFVTLQCVDNLIRIGRSVEIRCVRGALDQLRRDARASGPFQRRTRSIGNDHGDWQAGIDEGHQDGAAPGCKHSEASPLRHAPHTARALVGEWDRTYSREVAVFPQGVDPDKYWPPVARIDQAYGDRNLVCACPPPEAFAE